MKKIVLTTLSALFPVYDPTRTNLVGAIVVGVAILLISEYAY